MHYNFHYRAAVGDEVVLSAFTRDFHATYPEHTLSIKGNFIGVWENSPNVVPQERHAQRVKFSALPALREARDWRPGQRKQHYLMAPYEFFKIKTGLEVPCKRPTPALYLTEEEKNTPVIDGSYWVVVNGGKTDMTNKWWHTHRYQQVVDHLVSRGFHVVQEGGARKTCWHPRLDNVLYNVGVTSVRQMMQVIYHAQGIICGVSAPMHIAAAFDKPCVVLGGAREAPWSEHYTDEYNGFGPDTPPVPVPHKYLHTIGQVPCTGLGGCYIRRTVPLHDNHKVHEQVLCKTPNKEGPHPVPQCLDLIQSSDVIRCVDEYIDEYDMKPGNAPRLLLDKTPKILSSEYPGQKRKVRVETRDKGIIDKLTVCICMYGDYFDLHQKCLDNLFIDMPEDILDVRVAANQVCGRTREFLEKQPKQRVTKVYWDEVDRKKYPAMREMFYDSTCPITTKWLLWLDDDSFVRPETGNQWFLEAQKAIQASPDPNIGLLGQPLVHRIPKPGGSRFKSDGLKWFQAADWWKGRPLSSHPRRPGKEGRAIRFVAGGTWLALVQALRDADVPDKRLNHNGGDITIGEQIHQAGYSQAPYNVNKEWIFRSSVPRRGFREKAPWMNPEIMQAFDQK